jgi:ABC-type amino acid transport substrate-binding protein
MDRPTKEEIKATIAVAILSGDFEALADLIDNWIDKARESGFDAGQESMAEY